MNGLEISGEQQPVHGVPRRLGDDRVLNEEGNDAVGDLAQCWVREEVQDLEVEVSRSEASVFDETWRVGMRLLRGRESWAEMVQAVVFEMFGERVGLGQFCLKQLANFLWKRNLQIRDV